MIQEKFSNQGRQNNLVPLAADLVIVGGGIAGVCASITAARANTKVILVQDRPVLGGNASSEVRLWILGATSHMGNNNRWAREGGVIDELLLENTYRNKEGNPIIFDTILLEKVSQESNITLLLNTAVYDIKKSSDKKIKSISAFCSQNSTEYILSAPLFCDASGDGIVAFLSGASFRMGAEPAKEFEEGFAPDVEDYGELLGHSMYFYTKDAGSEVRFVPPAYALKDAGNLPRIRNYQLQDHGCKLWWVEYGGRMDTIHQSEEIKWELWRVIYGIWHHVKNSGEFPEAENLTLEWAGTIPGKRESRRFVGDYMLNQKDVIEQRVHDDAVAFGGWSLDLHPADGIFSEKTGCNQWHSKGIYQIPYRCYYSKDIQNLFLAGRIISASHVAFGSSRVMATCGHGAQAVGMAAALCNRYKLFPAQLYEQGKMKELQNKLNILGQSIPGVPYQGGDSITSQAQIKASSSYQLNTLPYDGPWMRLNNGIAQMLPLKQGISYQCRIFVKAEVATTLQCELRISEKKENHTPDVTLTRKVIDVAAGEHYIDIDFEQPLEHDQYAFITFLKSEHLWIKGSSSRLTGILSVFNKIHKAVSNNGKQEPPEGLGIETFEFWTPERRPNGHNIGMEISPALTAWQPQNLIDGFHKPTYKTSAWMAELNDPAPAIHLTWDRPRKVSTILLHFDTDFDHPLESTLMGHPENVMPFCVRNYRIRDQNGKVIYEKRDNYQTLNSIALHEPILADRLILELEHPSDELPAALFAVYCIPPLTF